jgi:hypothetical protein
MASDQAYGDDDRGKLPRRRKIPQRSDPGARHLSERAVTRVAPVGIVIAFCVSAACACELQAMWRIGAGVMHKMKAMVFRGVGDLRLEDVPRPRPNAGEAVIRITATTICGTDVHIVKGEYPVKEGLILGHEPVGVIHELGSGLDEDYTVGERVIVGAITPCGQCFYCLNGVHSQCHGPLGGCASATPSTVPGPSTCSCRTRAPTSRSSPTV